MQKITAQKETLTQEFRNAESKHEKIGKEIDNKFSENTSLIRTTT